MNLDKVFVKIGHRFPPFSLSVDELRLAVTNGEIDPDLAYICYRGSETWMKLSTQLSVLEDARGGTRNLLGKVKQRLLRSIGIEVTK